MASAHLCVVLTTTKAPYPSVVGYVITSQHPSSLTRSESSFHAELLSVDGPDFNTCYNKMREIIRSPGFEFLRGSFPDTLQEHAARYDVDTTYRLQVEFSRRVALHSTWRYKTVRPDGDVYGELTEVVAFNDKYVFCTLVNEPLSPIDQFTHEDFLAGFVEAT